MLPVLRNRSMMPSFIDSFLGKDLFNDFINQNYSIPSVNVVEAKNEFRVEVAAPGLKKEDFKIDLHNDVLTISSEKKDESEEKEEKYVRKEFSYCSFSRSFSLPETVETDKISATHKDGILIVNIPKSEKAKAKEPRKIEIF